MPLTKSLVIYFTDTNSSPDIKELIRWKLGVIMMASWKLSGFFFSAATETYRYYHILISMLQQWPLRCCPQTGFSWLFAPLSVFLSSHIEYMEITVKCETNPLHLATRLGQLISLVEDRGMLQVKAIFLPAKFAFNYDWFRSESLFTPWWPVSVGWGWCSTLRNSS